VVAEIEETMEKGRPEDQQELADALLDLLYDLEDE
jgi:hypothetical protein